MADAKIKTSKIALFIDTGAGKSSPTWSRVRKQSELQLKYDGSTEEDRKSVV